MLENSIKVLLVEDNLTDVLLVRATLTAAAGRKFEVTNASYLEAAIRLAATERFDVILLDLGLPDAQGIATFQRAHAGAGEIPIDVTPALELRRADS